MKTLNEQKHPFGLTKERLSNAIFIQHTESTPSRAKLSRKKMAKINYFAGPHCGFAAHIPA